MSAITEVRLDAPENLEYAVNGATVWVRTEQYETFVRVPKAVRSSFWKWGERGKITSGSVAVSGPVDELITLWDALRS